MYRAEIDRIFVDSFLEGRLSVTPTKVAVVADRSPLNIEAMEQYSRTIPGFHLRGIVVPGTELDQDVHRMIADESLMRAAYDDSPEVMEPLLGLNADGEPVDRGDFVLQQVDGITDEKTEFFRFAHEPYDAAKLHLPAGEGDAYRRRFGERLTAHLQHMDPDVVFLDNFKVILPEGVVRAFAGKIINVHPSVLPLLKGYRPEKRAYEGEHPDANGLTMHVVSEDLDAGPTLLQQRVPVLPLDQKLRAQIGQDAYQVFREEQARLRIMVAQSALVPWVLHVFNSDLDRKIVEGPAAFAAEGRPHFTRTQAYRAAMEADKHGEPYQRVLFENPLAASRYSAERSPYVTLEQLRGISGLVNVPEHISGIYHYSLEVPVLTDDPTQPTFSHVEHLVAALRTQGMKITMQTGQIEYQRAEVRLRVVGTDILRLLLGMKVAVCYDQQEVRVKTPRQPVVERRLQFADKK